MAASFVIVVQGAPGVGKTSLVNRLTKDFGVGIIAKDDIKELLFEKLGAPVDPAESKLYGKAVIKALFVIANDIVEGGKSFILECAFMPELADTDFDFIKKSDTKLVQLYCHTHLKFVVRDFTPELKMVQDTLVILIRRFCRWRIL